MTTDRDAWEPAGLELSDGDRVRVRLSGECRGRFGARGPLFPHLEAEDGLTGTVRYRIAVRRVEGGPGRGEYPVGPHCYLVTLDAPALGVRPPRECVMEYARAELERLGY